MYHFSSENELIFINDYKKIIFTFWEPHENIPGYLQLCIETWKKFLPDYEIKILDYNSIKYYLGETVFTSIISLNMSLMIQADAIRVVILKKYGGIWMDADTIITNGTFIKELKNYELVMIGDEKYKIQHIGFIFASTNSSILGEWSNKIINNIKYYNQLNNHTIKSDIFNRWNYLGNGIIDPILRNITGKKYFRLDKYKINAFPELKFFANSSLNAIEKYKLFYFQKRNPEFLLNEVKGIIMLHNSWTPPDYKYLPKSEFLKKDILLSKLLSNILNIK